MAHGKKHGSGSWKVAYADFVTAMMAFFLLMWILNMVPPESKRVLSTYFLPTSDEKGAGGTHEVIELASNALVQAKGIPNPDPAAEQNTRFLIASRLKRIISDTPAMQDASGISADETGVLLRVNGNALFAPGSTALNPAARSVILGVREVLHEYNLHLIVRGHADAREPLGAYHTDWELSGARAAAVASTLLDGSGFIPTRVRTMAYGSTRPLLPGTTEANRTGNSRVEFYFHRPDTLNFGAGS